MIMATPTAFVSRKVVVSSRSALYVLVLCVLVVFSKECLVAGEATTSTVAAPVGVLSGSETQLHRLDLSYLHRCGAEDIANAIRWTLEDQRQSTDASSEEYPNANIETPTGEEDTLVDIDLTASLIGKNITEILLSLKRSESKVEQQEQEQQQQQSSPSIRVQLTARRNQLSPQEATAILEFVLANGPTNETTITAATAATIENAEIVDETTPSSEDQKEIETDSVPELEATQVSEAATVDGNATAATADAAADTDAATPNSSLTPPGVESDSNEKETEDGRDTESTETEATTTEATEKPIVTSQLRPAFVSIQTLDLGWNHLGSTSRRRSGARTVNASLRKLLANSERCPPTIRLDVCGLGPQACRDLAKGIVDRYQTTSTTTTSALPTPLTLELACNEGIGDVGVAALAAAIRTVASRDGSMRAKTTTERKKKRRKKKKASKESAEEGTEQEGTPNTKNESTDATEEPTDTEPRPRTILKRLDLSGCGIGDVGAEALAIALTNNPLCIQHLDLSNNKITDQGAAALAQALDASRPSSGCIETLDLSHNKDLGDVGAKQLASAFQRNGISKLILRSCKIRADGAACFGAALRSIGLQALRTSSSSSSGHRVVDLSGNPLGILSKTKKSGIKHSATALRSKATDTTKAYMNIIGKSLQKGLNSFNGVDTLESDDEAEEEMGDNEEEDESMKKCGALSLAEAFLRDAGQDETKDNTASDSQDQDRIPVHIELGLRHCSFDTKAAEALAAVLVESKQNPNMKLSMDMAMNHVLEEEILAALHDEEGYEDQLSDMAEVYLDALEVMREARERALRASRMAASRAKAQAEREAAWAAPPPSFGYDDEDYGRRGGEWSNDDDDDDDEDDDWEDPIPDDYEQNLEEEDYSDESW